MEQTNWKDIAELIGITAIVASLVFVGLQMKQAQEIAVSQVTMALAEVEMARDALLAEHADIWVRGSAGEELDPVETSIYGRLVSANAGRFFQSRAFYQLGFTDAGDVGPITTATLMHRHPGVRAEWQRRYDERARYRQPLLTSEFDVLRASGVANDELILQYVKILDEMYSDE